MGTTNMSAICVYLHSVPLNFNQVNEKTSSFLTFRNYQNIIYHVKLGLSWHHRGNYKKTFITIYYQEPYVQQDVFQKIN